MQEQTADQTTPAEAEPALRSVLVVDDSRAQRTLLTRMLSKWGYVVQEAPSAQAALDVCSTQAPDLVLSDWVMPEMDGLEFCQRFRAMQRDCYGYFILLTSKNERDDITRGFDAGADDFLSKPVNGAELRARLAAGERVLGMERELRQKNALVAQTLGELQAAHDLLRNDLHEARKLQQSLVRERFRDFGVAEVSLALRPLGHVGGDLVGMFPAGDQHVGVYGLDVSGHGVSSALMTARLAGYLSSTAPEQNLALRIGRKGRVRPRPTFETVAMLNDLILSEVETEHYFTMFLAILDMESGELEYTQAGHPCPLLLHASGDVEMLGSGGLPMGMLEGALYESVQVQLSPGDRLLIHSDGLTDITLPSGQFLGEEGLLSLVGEVGGLTGGEFLDGLLWELETLGGADGYTDDISAVVLDIKEPRPSG